MGGLAYIENGLLHFRTDNGKLDACKTLPGVFINNEWVFPKTRWILKSLQRMYPLRLQLDTSVLSWMNTPFGFYASDEYGNDVKPDLIRQDLLKCFPSFDMIPESKLLYPYQREAISWLICQPQKSGLLALSPGLGKTAVSILAARYMLRNKESNILILAPLTLLPTWEDQGRQWGHNITAFHQIDPPSGWVVTNYETMVKRSKNWEPIFDLIICDESVLLKNRKIQRVSKLGSFIVKCKTNRNAAVWFLSGSPITKAYDDLYSQFHLLQPKSFRSYWNFAENYTYVVDTKWAKTITQSKDGINIQDDFKDMALFMHQKDVLPDLPPIISQRMEIKLTDNQIKAYQSLRDQFMVQLTNGVRLTTPCILANMTRLIQVCSNLGNLGEEFPNSSAKGDAILDLLTLDAVEFPAIIWTHWVRGAELLYNRIIDAKINSAIVTGKTKDRDTIFKSFQAGNIQALVLSIETGKFGLTLTKAKTVIYMDRNFDADAWIQSVHRVHRIGQKEPVREIVMIARKTIDELVEKNIKRKLFAITKVSGGELKEYLSVLTGV